MRSPRASTLLVLTIIAACLSAAALIAADPAVDMVVRRVASSHVPTVH